MYNYKSLISQPVLSLYEGELLGIVDKLFLDKKLKKIIAVELIGEDGLKFLLQSKNIYHIGKSAITIKNNQCIELMSENQNLVPAPINLKAYTIQGEFLGIIKNINFNEKYLTTEIELDNNSAIKPNLVASSSKNAIIFFDKNIPHQLKQFSPNNDKFKKNLINTEKTEQNNENINKNKQKINFSSDFLIGRICTKDIYNFNNEILIKAHTIINKKNIKEIIKFGKIRELILFSK